jgi:hypothetical protein
VSSSQLPAHSEPRYETTVERDRWYDGMNAGYCWRVRATRLSDRESIEQRFEWHWRARRFAQSRRRLDAAFKAHDRAVAEALEGFLA